MQAVLNWTPVGGANSTGQSVQYRLKGAGTWTTHSSVGAAVTTATITGLLDNEVYEFQIVNNCTTGGPTPSATIENVKLTCPTVTTSNLTYNSIDYSFSALGGDVDTYDVQLLNSGSAVVTTQSKPTAATVTGTFSGLSASTSYSIRVIPKIGATYQKTDCATTGFTTSAAPACGAPTGLSATIS